MAVNFRTQPPGPKTLIGILGLTAAAFLFQSIPEDEGTVYQAYRDVVGVWTICSGDTYDVRPGQKASRQECEERLSRQLINHAEPVMLATPRLADPGRDYQRAAAVSLAYNIGVNGYKTSSVDRNFDAGRWVQGCSAIKLWNKGRFTAAQAQQRMRTGGSCSKSPSGVWYCVVRGLDLRRKREEQVCLTNLLPGHTPENLRARMDKFR